MVDDNFITAAAVAANDSFKSIPTWYGASFQ